MDEDRPLFTDRGLGIEMQAGRQAGKQADKACMREQGELAEGKHMQQEEEEGQPDRSGRTPVGRKDERKRDRQNTAP